MNSQFVIQAVIVLASLILGMMLYPRLVKTYTRLVTKLYKNLGERDDKKEKTDMPGEPDKKAPKEEIPSSVIGASRTVTGHSRTKAATVSENEKVIEKERIFATHTDETEENPEPMDNINVPLERIENPNPVENEVDPEEEMLNLEPAGGLVHASGASYDQLMDAGSIITKDNPDDEEKDRAGQVLYENRNTSLFEQIIAASPALSKSIAEMIDFHLTKLAGTEHQSQQADYPDDLAAFDFDSLF